jgi:hypothetical protein
MQTEFDPPGQEAIHIATQRAASLRSMLRSRWSARPIATSTLLTPATPDAGALEPGTAEAVPGGDRGAPVPETGPLAPQRSAFAVRRMEIFASAAGRRRVYLLVALLVVAVVGGVALTWPQIMQRGTSTDSPRAATVPVNAAPPPLLPTTPPPTVTVSADSASPAATVATNPPATQASPAKPRRLVTTTPRGDDADHSGDLGAHKGRVGADYRTRYSCRRMVIWLSPIAESCDGARTAGHGDRVIFQDDGHLVVYDISMQPWWQSGTAGHGGAVLVLQADGDVCIVDHGTVIWHAGTAH